MRVLLNGKASAFQAGYAGSIPATRFFFAHVARALIAVACSPLDRWLAAQERAFLQEGGLSEHLRRQSRKDP